MHETMAIKVAMAAQLGRLQQKRQQTQNAKPPTLIKLQT